MDGVIDRVEWYEEILKEDSRSPIFAELAELLYEDGRFEDVIDICRRGLIANPGNIKGEVYLGLALLATGQHEEGILHLKTAKNRFRDYAVLFKALAEVYKKEGDGEEAERMTTISRLLDASRAEKVTIVISEPRETPSSRFAQIQPAPEIAKEPPPPTPIIRLNHRINQMLTLLEKKLTSAKTDGVFPKISLFDQDDRNMLAKYVLSMSRRKSASIH
jgi:tetratricopeptide (TPR) repeat protein